MEIPETIKKACQVLRARVRLDGTRIELKEVPGENATPIIREATRLYTESWIIPLIDMIEGGKIRELKYVLKGENHIHKIEDTEKKFS